MFPYLTSKKQLFDIRILLQHFASCHLVQDALEACASADAQLQQAELAAEEARRLFDQAGVSEGEMMLSSPMKLSLLFAVANWNHYTPEV